MANTVERPEEDFPAFELDYSDGSIEKAGHVASRQGRIFVHLADGGAFEWIRLHILSSPVPLKLKYRCLYRQSGSEDDVIAEASDGLRCPREGAAYIKKVAFESKIYYRCWLSRDGHPDAFEQVPGGTFWCPSGRFCGTDEDGHWITALEIKMPPVVNLGQSF